MPNELMMSVARDQLTKAQRRDLTKKFLSDMEAVRDMLATIGAGMGLRDACAIQGLAYSTVQEAFTTREEFIPLYRAARIRQAEAVLDEIKTLEERLEGRGDPIDSKAAAVLIGSKQWRAERLNPKLYGPRSFQQIETIDQTRLHLEALRTVGSNRRRALPPSDAQDAEPAEQNATPE